MKFKKNVLDNILEKRNKAIRKADERLDFALQNDEFKAIYLKLKELNFNLAKEEFEGRSTKQTLKEIKSTKSQAESVLDKMQMKFSDFEPKYHCKKCQDRGVVDGKPCTCYFEELSLLTTHSLCGNVDKTHTFESSQFEMFDNKEEYKKNFDKLQMWCKKIDSSQYKNLLLCGKTGVGKTFLTECLINEFVKEGKSAIFHSAFALDNLFLKYHTTFDSEKDGLLDGVLNCDVLAIDDLGSEPIYKNVTAEYLYLVVGERLSNNKTTIVSTNLSFDEIIDRYGERTFSRLCNKRNTIILKMQNSDLRRKK